MRKYVLETFYFLYRHYIVSYAYMDLIKFLIEFDVLLFFFMHKTGKTTTLLN